MNHDLVITLALTALLLPAVVFDCRRHRIPNWLSLTGWCVGPALHALFGGWPAATDALLGLGLLLAITFPLFVVGWFGAGDVKLMAAVGGLVSIENALVVLLAILITGGLFGLVRLVRDRTRGGGIDRITTSVGFTFALGRPIYLAPTGGAEAVVLPYAVSIAVGTAIGWMLTQAM